METRFSICLRFTLEAEGGFVDNPDDPGGATNKGITLRLFQRYRPKATVEDLRNIDDTTLTTIYNCEFWIPTHCGGLPAGVDLMVFDMAVNAGPGTSIRMLQRAVDVKADGFIGPATLAAIRSHQPTELVASLAQAQLRYYEGLPGWGEFGRGWSNRVTARQTAALKSLGPAPSDHHPESVASAADPTDHSQEVVPASAE
jgi:lysozyme family protein